MALLIVALLNDWPPLAESILLGFLVAPSLIATIIVLEATPRKHFEAMSSVFGHFFVRYLALVVGVIAWGTSVVVGAAISQIIQLGAEGREDDIVGSGIEIMALVVPSVITLLWGAFVLRCGWFLVHLRGWREVPRRDRIPAAMLHRHPGLRRVVLGLAHPVLFTISGLISAAATPVVLLSLDL